MKKEMKKIQIEQIKEKGPIHPLTLFIKMAKVLGAKEAYIDTNYDSLVYSFDVFKTKATQEFIDALNFVRTISRRIEHVECNTRLIEVSYICSKKNNECIRLRSFDLEYIYETYENDKYQYQMPSPDNFVGRNSPKREIHIYDNGIAWNYTKKPGQRKAKGFPCSMKDFFYYQDHSNLEHEVFYALFMAWGSEYPIWKDLAEDFKNGTAYSSIPLDLIFSCHNRMELIEKRYGISFKRNNKENIGQGIFYARASRVVKEDELQKLFGFQILPYYIGREKADLIIPLSRYIIDHIIKNGDVKETGTETIRDSWLVQDAIKMAIDMRRKISLTFNSWNGVRKWHNDLAVKHRCKGLATVKIPKESKFKNLKLPDNCVRLKTRKMFVEEGGFQHNCVTSYINDVNRDRCSIWSMRKEDGTRNTIEIVIKRNMKTKEYEFDIAQMRGFANKNAPREDIELIKKCLEGQVPYKKEKEEE